MRMPLIAFAAALALTPAIAAAQAAAPAAAAASHYSTDNSTVGEIMADPAAKAVVDKYVPGMLASDQIEMAKEMTLKQLQQYVPDHLSDKTLSDIDAEFAKLPVKQ